MQNNQFSKEELISKIPIIEIDPEGTFKYILFKCRINDKGPFYFIRGYKKYEFHADNFQHFYKQLKKVIKWDSIKHDEYEEETINKIICQKNGINIVFECVGGGRVQHSQSQQKFFIYGYSQSYGQADHNISLEIIKQNTNYPNKNYSISFDGY